MVILSIEDLELDNPEDHLATDWQVSTTMAFNDIVLNVVEDHVNLRNIVFKNILDPNIKYYARARALLKDKGYTIWGNLDVFKPVVINDLEENKDLPSKISIPNIDTNFPSDAHNVSLFEITATGFSVVGTAVHVATSWFIEDAKGNIVWERLNDTINIEKIIIDSILLQEGEIYRIRAMFHSNTNDVSQVATKTIYTKPVEKIIMNPEPNSLLNNIDNTISILPDIYLTNVEWQIFQLLNNKLIPAWSSSTIDNSVIIPSNTLKDKSNYILKISSNISDVDKFILFTTHIV